MSELGELLQPTVTPAQKRPLPWRVSSQFWVAFFGGVPAVTAIAFLNARRLGASARKQQWIVVAGTVAFLVMIALFAWLGVDRGNRSVIRIAGRLLAVLLFLVLARIQRDEAGHHEIFGSDRYASLWGPGIVASLASAVVTFVIGFGVVFALRSS